MADGAIILGDQNYPANYLSPERLDHFQTFVQAEARRLYNPFVELAAKIAVLPPDLQVVAVQTFTATVDFAAVPHEEVLNVMASTRTIQTLCILVTGEDLVTPENAHELYPQLTRFIKREEIAANSTEEVNALRAEAGKAPIGG
jgi:hypothetical protein